MALLLIGCNNRETQRFTAEQIASLHLNSAKLLNIEEDSVEIIDINPFLGGQSFDFQSLINEIKVIPLETTQNSLLDAIYKVLATDSNIYVHDRFKGGGLVIFDAEGKFIRRVPNGIGPGELNRLYDIDFDEENNELIAYVHSFLLFYNANGEFLRQERVPLGFYNFISFNNGYVFKTLGKEGNEHLGDLKNKTLLITDKRFKIKYFGLPHDPYPHEFWERHYLHKNKDLYVTQRFSDVIYQIDPLSYQLKKKYILDFNSKKLPSKFLHNNLDDFVHITRNNDYYYYLGKYLDSGNHHVFTLRNDYRHTLILYRDKRNGKMKGGARVYFNLSDIPPSVAFPSWASGNYFISAHMPGENDLFATESTILSAGDKEKIRGLNANDNPVLVFFNLKKF